MKVLYDNQIFKSQRFGGISRYFYELMNHSKGLYEYDIPYIYYDVPDVNSENIYGGPLHLYKQFPINFHFKGKGRIINILNRLDSIKKIKKKEYDIIHPTYYDPYLLKYTKNVPLIIDVHDMIYEKMPEYVYKDDNTSVKKRKYFIRSDAIIANSKKTKDDLLAIHPEIPKEKVKVIYRGEVFSEYKKNPEKENYILFTGQREGYKNFTRFIEAVASLLIRYDLKLICTGKSFTNNERILLDQYKITNKTKAVFVSEAELQDFYSKALLFVYPSLYEGFGFPILEAFASGCPALLSDTSCFPEIAKDAAMYFNPYSTDDMREKIKKVLLDSSIQTNLIEKGFERVKYFSWEKCAKETMEVYKRL